MHSKSPVHRQVACSADRFGEQVRCRWLVVDGAIHLPADELGIEMSSGSREGSSPLAGPSGKCDALGIGDQRPVLQLC